MWVRFLAGAPVAAIVTIELFLMMHSLIADKDAAIDEDAQRTRIVLNQAVEDITPLPKRELLPADIAGIIAPPPAPRIAVIKTGAPTVPGVGIAGRIPALSVRDVDISRQDINFRVSDRDAQPLVRIPPLYPPRAAERGVEGDCLMVFDVGPDGTPYNIRIRNCSSDIFAAASLRAVEQWRYAPKIVKGQTVARTEVETLITYRFES